MKKTKIISVIGVILSLAISTPIWFFLLYRILLAINASELTWFLYWVYIPLGLLGNLLVKIAED